VNSTLKSDRSPGHIPKGKYKEWINLSREMTITLMQIKVTVRTISDMRLIKICYLMITRAGVDMRNWPSHILAAKVHFREIPFKNQVVWYMVCTPVIPALSRQRQKDHKFKASLGSQGDLVSKKKKRKIQYQVVIFLWGSCFLSGIIDWWSCRIHLAYELSTHQTAHIKFVNFTVYEVYFNNSKISSPS
jgi:hypothetical protein